MTRPWGSDDTDREYHECDPERHDAVGYDGPCRCSHPEDDHTHSDGGCAWHGCPCRWFDPETAVFDDDLYEEPVGWPASHPSEWIEVA